MNRIIRLNNQKLARLERELIIPMRGADFAGRYKLEAMRPDGRLRPLTGWFDNLITDFGLNFIGTNGGWLSYCCVGSGNTAPANSDTTLVSQVAAGAGQTSSTGSVQSSAPYFGTRTNVYQFAQGAAAGNLAEVGVGSNINGTGLWSRALILDSGGSPTTITVLSDEFLNVTYQMMLYPRTTDTTGTVSIGGVTYNYTARAANVTAAQWIPGQYGGDNFAISGNMLAYSGVIGDITSQPAGSGANSSSFAAGTYSANSLYNTGVATYSLNVANFALPGGVKSLYFYGGSGGQSMGLYQIGYSNGGNGIPKDSSSILTLGAKVSWGRGT